VPVFGQFQGNDDLRSKGVIAYELGYRARPVDSFSWDVGAYFNDYSDLRGNIQGAPIIISPGFVAFPVTPENALTGEGYGTELTATWKITDCWKLYGAYIFLQLQLHGPAVPDPEQIEGSSPHNIFYAQSSCGPGHDMKSNSRNYRVLIIDDQESIHDDFRKVIGRRSAGHSQLDRATAELLGEELGPLEDTFEGFDIDCASQGMEGFELVQKSLQEGRHYAVAFVDIRMPPGWDGIETVKRIWAIDPAILVVLCTAYSDYSWDQMVRELGRSDRFLILKKPFDNIEVRQLAMALCEKWHLAQVDPLTGLMNRRAFHEHFERELSRSERHDSSLGCVVMDVDFFKKINDTRGHNAGDRVLIRLGQVLRELARGSDCVCRYGGEEFCILLAETDEKGAAAWAERARAAIAEMKITSPGVEDLRITASFGVAERLADVPTQELLISRADEALLVAKQSGRNRVARYSWLGRPFGVELAQQTGVEDLFQGILARHVMTSPVAALKCSTTIGAATDFFLQARLNSAPVVNDDGKLAGILSEKDVMSLIQQPDAWDRPVSEIMQTNVVAYGEDAPIQSIFDFLCRVTIRRIVIVNDGRPTGVISRGSLLRWYTNWSICRQGRSSSEVPRSEAAIDPAEPRLAAATQALLDHATYLAQEVARDSEDLVPPVIAGASKMQELLNDVLAYSRYLNRRRSMASADEILMGSSPLNS
jgi:two-component system cell cycle response regulator